MGGFRPATAQMRLYWPEVVNQRTTLKLQYVRVRMGLDVHGSGFFSGLRSPKATRTGSGGGHPRPEPRSAGHGRRSANLFEPAHVRAVSGKSPAWPVAHPFIDVLVQAVREHTGIRDYLHGEKVVQSFLAAYLSIAGYFVLCTGAALGKAEDESRIPPAGRAGGKAAVWLPGRRTPRKLHADVAFTGLALAFHGWELASAAEVAPTP